MGFAQTFEEHLLNTQAQLPVSAIHSAYRDKDGYMWYGTVNGLCRDDGYNIRIFRPDFLQAQDRVIGSMCEDDDMHLWLGADNGLFWLDKRDLSIAELCPEQWEGERISRITPMDGKRKWIQCRSKVALIDSVGRPIKQYLRTNRIGQPVFVESMEVNEGNVFVSFADNSFARLDSLNSTWKDIKTPEPDYEISCIHNNVIDGGLLVLFSNGKIYQVTYDGGNAEFRPYACDEAMEYYSYDIRLNPADSTIWAMNSFGLRGYRMKGDHRLEMIYSSMTAIPQYNMFASVLCCDSAFNFVSSFDRPSFMLRKSENSKTHLPIRYLSDRLKFSTVVMDLAEDTDGWMWMFQERTGLCLINDKQKKAVLWSECPDTRKYGLNKGRIIVNANEGGIWINHDDRMEVYRVVRKNESMHVFAEINLSHLAQAGEIVSMIYEDKQSRVWIGTNLGLYIYHAKTLEQIAAFPNFGYVSDAKSNEKGVIWITTLDGELTFFEHPTISHTVLQTEPLSALCFEGDNIWLGTQAGHILRYNTITKETSDQSEACGMNGDRVNQMVTDRFGHIWIETNQRIIEYNGRNKATHIYSTHDGSIPMVRFIPTAVLADSRGRICFGGIPGIICFEPSSSLDKKAQPAKTFITDIQVMKQSLLLGSGTIRTEDHIELQSDDRDLEIFFSSLDHYHVRQVRYAYRMIGVDKDWKYTVGGENSAFYNQLNKGEYVFEVKATDGNGLWSDDVARLHIKRLPAFYESNIAYLCYALILIALIALLVRQVQKHDSMENERMWNDSQEMLKMRNYLYETKPAETAESLRLPESEYKQLDQAFVQKVEKNIQAHFDEADFGVEELAASVNVSKSTLSRKLKSITGQSPLDYIRQMKMRQACLWLQDKDRNITEIAISLGYSDRKYFTSCFKKEIGQTPTEYRKDKLGIKTDEEI